MYFHFKTQLKHKNPTVQSTWIPATDYVFSLFRTNAVHLKLTFALEYRFNNPDLQGLTSL